MATPSPYPTPEEHLQEILDSRTAQGLLRALHPRKGTVDLASNDYLGLSRSPELQLAFADALQQQRHQPFGAGGSRLLTGNSAAAEQLEAELAAFHGFPRSLLFNSGYQANLGIYSSIASRQDTIILDEKAHASMIDGARLSRARLLRFRHNDPASLQEKLHRAQGRVVVGIESVYSMGGACAPLHDLVEVCRQHGAGLVVDEAHAIGVFGPQGAGRLSALGLQDEVMAAVVTFGKAVASHGAAVLCGNILHEYLINFARSFIYTTALPNHSVLAIRLAHRFMRNSDRERAQLHGLIHAFRERAAAFPHPIGDASDGPIQSLLIPGIEKVRAAATALQAAGLDIRPILSPTVPAGQEQLRVCLHAFNTDSELALLFNELQTTLAA